jgi:uncharacterized radical SAM protein YgiQ
MVANFTAFKRPRSDDPYAPGGLAGAKPKRALIVYCNQIKALYKGVPLVIGGIEASLRRLLHYDYWDNGLRRSVLLDARADILAYGMAEHAILEIATAYRAGRQPQAIPGTVVYRRSLPSEAAQLPSQEAAMSRQQALLQLYRQFYEQQSRVWAQPSGKGYLVYYPSLPMSASDLDRIYALPFTRQPHPHYQKPIPAWEMIRDSITAHRGCVSGCSFCSLGLHQGRAIVSRSKDSILKEATLIAKQPQFKGHIKDIGGPSANMYGLTCGQNWQCRRTSCLFPRLCPHLHLNTKAWLGLYEQVSHLPGIKRATIGSGLRYDLLMQEPRAQVWLQQMLNHISGQLKIAPEHLDPVVLQAMHKVPLYDVAQFCRQFYKITASAKQKLYLLPYLMTAHPGSTQVNTARTAAQVGKIFGFQPEQIQCFIPLPMTVSSIIFYTGHDPLTGKTFEVCRDQQKRRKQQQLFFDKSQNFGKKPKNKQKNGTSRLSNRRPSKK